ncbi:MAG: hypothetical protein AAGL66_02500 [Pseudomonadota bacterium]
MKPVIGNHEGDQESGAQHQDRLRQSPKPLAASPAALTVDYAWRRDAVHILPGVVCQLAH